MIQRVVVCLLITLVALLAERIVHLFRAWETSAGAAAPQCAECRQPEAAAACSALAEEYACCEAEY